ncbi:flagellin [Oscillospiraceae bacterium PP1C4]
MGMVVRSNIMALNANRQLGMNNTTVTKSLEKLSSGFRINRAGDDASGLAISEKMKAQIKGLETASANAQDGISLVQTAEGSLTEVHDMLNRMTELATKASNGTQQDKVDREAIQAEVDSLKSEIDRISQSSNFNGIKLLDGTIGAGSTKLDAASAATYQVGVAIEAGKSVITEITGMSTNKVGTYTFEVGDMAAGTWTAAATGGTLRATFTEAGTNNVVNTDLKLEDIVSGNVNGAIGNKQTVDLSSVGLGKFTVTASAADAVGNGAAGAIAGAAGSVVNLFAAKTLTTVAGAGTGGSLALQVGDTAEAFNKVSVSVDDMSTTGLGIDKLSVATADTAAASIKTIKDAINTVSTNRANLGATQNRLEHTINNLDVTAENMTSANSRIRDTDMAKEMMNYTKMNVLTQAAQAMLAQANQQPQSVLQLLQ